MKRLVIIIVVIVLIIFGVITFNNSKEKQVTMENVPPSTVLEDSVNVNPISHATMILQLGNQVMYTDPTGGADAFAEQPSPNLILITDIHGDHLDAETLTAVSKDDTVLFVPQAVADLLPDTIPGTIVVLANGEKTTQKGIEIEAIPMYNVPESADSRHTKGRGNGYIISAEGQRVYIAGDTGATAEMRALKDIDVAFVPMNPPTMTVEEAAEGVLAFKPKVVHPYHYRGQGGLSDINRFKEIVEAGDKNIKVELLNFYPN